MSVDLEGRMWVHEELPEGVAGRPGYQLGCRCGGCTAANATYMREYRARMQHNKQRMDGTAEYHSHKGQPSKRTARKWGCTHTMCLSKAGLYLDDQGVVRVLATKAVDPSFGEVAVVA